MLQAEVWRFSPQGMESLFQRMNKNPIHLTRWTDTELVGNIRADRPGVMYTSIPYDKGWRILVDGRPAAGRTIFDTFLAVDLDEGAHRDQPYL